MTSPMERLLDFMAELDSRRVSHRLNSVRPGAVMVEVAVPGERWEVEFFTDGKIEIERFRSDGMIYDEAEMARLFEYLDVESDFAANNLPMTGLNEQ